MDTLTREDLDQEALQFDALVAQTHDLDLFCSSSLWTRPADDALMSGRPSWIKRCDAGYVAMAQGTHPEGWTYLQPLECMWGLANPFIGPDPLPLVDAFYQECRKDASQWEALLLSGVVKDSALYHVLVRQFGQRYRVRMGYPRQRFAASLEGGLDGFLSRRKRKFRANLRRTTRQSQSLDLSFEVMPHDGGEDVLALYKRIVRLEEQSWKGKEMVGINTGDMHHFYKAMLPRLAARDALRGLFVKNAEGDDTADPVGGVFAGAFRGRRFSYRQDCASLSLGNLAQLHMVELLAEEPEITLYDLGSEMDYKRRWAEGGLETVMLLVMQ